MKPWPVIIALALTMVRGAIAQTTNGLSTAEIQGQALVQKILQQWPAENFTNTGALQIRGLDGKRTVVPITFQVTVTATNWTSRYDAGLIWFTTTHTGGGANLYSLHAENGKETSLSGNELMFPFAGSDFWLADLGLDFFHWPHPKVLRREVHRSCGCSVLECLNPSPSANGYSRVDLWIDNDSLGIVDAYAYDAQGRDLKNFYPKDLKKVNGQYQVESMIMLNDRTKTRTRLEFDLKGK